DVIEEERIDETVVDHDLRLGQPVASGDSKEAGVARPGADQGDEALLHASASMPARDMRRSAIRTPSASASALFPVSSSRRRTPSSVARKARRRSALSN